MMEKSIAILICWYGQYPWHVPYFIHSCNHNPTIDFIIITDSKNALSFNPTNVKVIQRDYKTVFHKVNISILMSAILCLFHYGKAIN